MSDFEKHIHNHGQHHEHDHHEHDHHEHNCEEVKALARKEMPADETLNDLAEAFKVFGDFTRIKILFCLFEAEMCVCDITELVGATQSAVSHQLRLLKNAGLVKSKREGKQILYSLSDDHVRTIINQGMEHVLE